MLQDFDSNPTVRDLSKTVNIAVYSRALFDLEEEHAVYEKDGQEAFLKLQKERENQPLKPGPAFPFIKALEYVNSQLMAINKDEKELFDTILMSHSHADTSLRMIKSIMDNGLRVERMCLTDGENPVQYLESYNIKLFLSSSSEEVTEALQKGIAAARMISQFVENPIEDQLRIAFDLDGVIFNRESEKLLRTKGLFPYIKSEQSKAKEPLGEGHLASFAQAIGRMQKKFREQKEKYPKCPIRVYLVTARGTCVGERAIRTIQGWGIEVNEAHFLALAPKGPVLKVICPHIFFDDSAGNCVDARDIGVPTGHVDLTGLKLETT